MDFGEKSRVMEVLNKAFAGSVVDKRVAAAAIREFQGILDELYKQPPRWELVTMRRSEVDNMREVIRYQDEKIRSITDKVNSLGLNGGDASPKFSLQTDKERQDTERRLSLASRFNAVYEVEWKASFSELATTMNWSDLECIYTLMRVIRNACDLCVQLAEDQMDKMLLSMEDSVLDPLNGTGGRLKQLFEQQNSEVYSDGMKVAEKYALEYRKERAEASVPAVIELFMETKLRAIIEPQYMRREFKKYLLKVIELVWLMTTLDPPVRLYWQSQTERINADFFEFYFRKGDFVNQTVWPAVFLHNTGRLLHKGQVLAM
ncbi:uncharacterized protein LOC127844060 [Dreissena polymorpha]|uniref:Mitochondria-eating protein C-terminal domain-containing protein n=1 Tax=Dreissena polymorpha TaxID=45954 RepID=A0A9D4E9B0_DREPO|nr:uncharacterized protein LOC127844060 [Dreissena polymorpha]KAH3774704.1 hypothetical protein DPMN_176092 [Dreissena polymorpha]